MSAISPSTHLASDEVFASEPSQLEQPSANFVATAKPTHTAKLKIRNGFYSKQPFHPAPKKPEQGKRLSLEEYLRQYAEHPDFNYEWNAGILEEKPVSTIAQLRLYRWFLQILSYYLEVNHLAEAAMFEFLTEMEAGDKLVKRKPDLLIVRHDNPIPLHDDDVSYAGVCDLCVELLSTSNQANIDRDIKVKKAEYAAAGVSPGSIETGAVIITGEAARTKNADSILTALSAGAGDFVVSWRSQDQEGVGVGVVLAAVVAPPLSDIVGRESRSVMRGADEDGAVIAG